MQLTYSHPTYGLISCEESAWTGKKTICFDGIPLVKKNKTTYELPATDDTPALTVTVKGSYVTGLNLIIGAETIELTQAPRWYDYVLAILPAVLFWCFIIGGAIGGAVAGMMAVGGIMLMKSLPKVWQKLLVSLGVSFVIVAVGIVLLIAILGAAA